MQIPFRNKVSYSFVLYRTPQTNKATIIWLKSLKRLTFLITFLVFKSCATTKRSMPQLMKIGFVGCASMERIAPRKPLYLPETAIFGFRKSKSPNSPRLFPARTKLCRQQVESALMGESSHSNSLTGLRCALGS